MRWGGTIGRMVIMGLAFGPASWQSAISSPLGAGDEGTLETFVIEPIDLASIRVRVPADKEGPMINRACQDLSGCLSRYRLPAEIQHTKNATCPAGLARSLAEYVWPRYQESLPLTIFNGWKWEFSYSLSQYEALEYTLPRQGGSWENAVEAVLNETRALIRGSWLALSFSGQAVAPAGTDSTMSEIKIRTFSSIKVRHGYPKVRQLQNN